MKAIILAAGRGTRMGDLTEDLPKVLLPYQGKPFLHHILDRMIEAGVSEFVIVVGYKKEKVIDAVGSYRSIPTTFVDQRFPIGTAHALSLCGDFIGNDNTFLLTYGDILFAVDDYRHLINAESGHIYAVNRVEDSTTQDSAVYFDQRNLFHGVDEKPNESHTPIRSPYNMAGLFRFPRYIFESLYNKSPDLAGLRHEWVLTRHLVSFGKDMAVVYPVKEWIHIKDQITYTSLS